MKTLVFELLSGLNISKSYSVLKNTQWQDEDFFNHLKLEKFKKLVAHCYNNVPFYRNYMLNNSISVDDIKSISDLEVFPIVTKEIIKDNYMDFIPRNIKSIPGVNKSMTGGTTGNLLLKRNDLQTRSIVWASYKRFLSDFINISYDSPKLILMGGHVLTHSIHDKVKSRVINFLLNQQSFNIYDNSEENYRNIINSLKSNNYMLIRSYSQFLYNFALDLQNMNLTFNIPAVSTTAEPLMKQHRLLFKNVFNAESFDQYGCGEIGGIAYECGAHNGMHITEEHVILETNENNELLITDLDNFSMPFIRYHNGDQAIIDYKPCQCGRKSPRITNLLGRTCDYIIGVNGKLLHWAYFWHLFFDSNIGKKRNLRKFQVIQENYESITIKLVCDNPSHEDIEPLNADLYNRLGNNMKITYEICTDIAVKSGSKYRPVINYLLTSKK